MSASNREALLAERLETARQVAGQIAHDFNNLLTPLLAYPELIRHEVKPNALVNDYLAIIEKTAGEMQSLTQKLLVLARRVRVSNEVFCVNKVIDPVLQELQEGLPPGIGIKCDLADDLKNILGSQAQIHIALVNICQNAVEAMGASGLLTIKTENVRLDLPVGGYDAVESGDYVKISLMDTGVGIAGDVRGKIFDPFFTTKRTNKQRGSGLGLSIVQGIIKDFRGYIDFDSAPGSGTTFSLYIPITHVEVKPEPVAPVPKVVEPVLNAMVKPSGSNPASPPRILIADDEQMIRKLFGMIVKSEFPEASIDQASDGTEAVEMFSKGGHDLVIMDLQMPGQDGRGSFFEIQKICKTNRWSFPPFIFCTGFTPSESLAGIIKDSSVHCLLRKPIKAELLLESIRMRLRR